MGTHGGNHNPNALDGGLLGCRPFNINAIGCRYGVGFG